MGYILKISSISQIHIFYVSLKKKDKHGATVEIHPSHYKVYVIHGRRSLVGSMLAY